MHIQRAILMAALTGLLLPGFALAGNMAEWTYTAGGWSSPNFAPGSFTHGVAAYQAGGVNEIVALSDASGVAEYYRLAGPPGQYGFAGQVLNSPTVRDVDSDDLRNGSRMFITDATGINEIRWVSPSWIVESTIATGSDFVAGTIANDQDRLWALKSDGTIYEYNRTGATTWAQMGDIFPGSYVDVACRSRNITITFGLRDTGFDEFAGGQLVRSHNDLFSGATGIAVWSDYDNVFVSTKTGLLHLVRDSGLSFTPAGVRVIDGSIGYLDVEAPTEMSGTAFDLWAIQVPEPTTAFGLLLAVSVLVRRRH
ncbi:MAG TPA: PEP-CTERM sorting domain-containing protein [Phycisphaerae bacterium]|nr:PEP-CTERM sorting domain-containing protein [Phycisphaerae bacterium]HRY67131.1 PEP-CTERM sorting domain-containing protein [Phycisphaerae bacterium]HSA26500.1 PEP-CTERM sorting domain-containing protein [Phycisphaerae bacterium]